MYTQYTVLFMQALATLFVGVKSVTWRTAKGLYTLTLTRKGEYKLTEWLTDGTTLAIIAADGTFSLRCTERQIGGVLNAMDALEALVFGRRAWATQATICASDAEQIGDNPEYGAWKQDIVKAGLGAVARDNKTEAWALESLHALASSFGWMG